MRQKKNKLINSAQVIFGVLSLVILSACFNLRIHNDVKNPDPYFREAYMRIKQLHRDYPDRDGKCREVKLLIFNRTEQKLIKIATPIWIVEKCLDMEDFEEEFDFEENYQVAWREIKDLRRIGPGLLVEVDDEDNRILIWIE